METVFRNRTEAGRLLAEKLSAYAGDANAIVLALPRGGLPVGYEVAEALGIPLDVFLVRKLGTPGGEELAMGAIAEGGARLLNKQVIVGLQIPEEAIERVALREAEELERRGVAYRAGRRRPELAGKTVILVDDGLATGATMRVAVQAVRQHHPGKIVVAVPVAPPETCDVLRCEADEVVCYLMPHHLTSVGSWYLNFDQTSDEEVMDYLRKAVHLQASHPVEQ
jgi:predicted phosphoribosyltransferase